MEGIGVYIVTLIKFFGPKRRRDGGWTPSRSVVLFTLDKGGLILCRLYILSARSLNSWDGFRRK